MENQQPKFNFSLLRTSIWLTLFLSILKFTGMVNLSPLWVFMPIIVAVGFTFLGIFIIGLLVVYLISTGEIDTTKESEIEKKTEEES